MYLSSRHHFPILSKETGVWTVNTETKIHSLGDLRDFLVSSQTNLSNSDSNCSLSLKTGRVSLLPLSHKQDISLFGLFVYWLLISLLLLRQGNTNTAQRKEGVSFKNLFNTPLSFSSPKKGHKQEKGSSSLQEPTWPTSVQWSGTLTPDPDLLLTSTA